MKRITTNSLVALVLATGVFVAGQEARANEYAYEPAVPDVMYNYYAQDPVYGVPAEMYTSPITTPPVTGYTYYTYPPFYPHEHLYQHHRTYYNYYNGGQGLNRTKVHWYHLPALVRPYNPLF